MNQLEMSSHSQSVAAEETALEQKKKNLKKSIAKMMVYWVAHTRHDLHADLIANNPDSAWAGLALMEAFEDETERRAFFNVASRVFNEEVDTEVETESGEKIQVKMKVVEEGAKRISQRVHGKDGMTASPTLIPPDWDSDLDPFCPGDPTLDAMYKAAADFVDNNW